MELINIRALGASDIWQVLGALLILGTVLSALKIDIVKTDGEKKFKVKIEKGGGSGIFNSIVRLFTHGGKGG